MDRQGGIGFCKEKLCYNKHNYRKDDDHEIKAQLTCGDLWRRLDLWQHLWRPGLLQQSLGSNSNYRPINFGMGYEMYVDLSSLETIKDNGQAGSLRSMSSARRKIRDASKGRIP